MGEGGVREGGVGGGGEAAEGGKGENFTFGCIQANRGEIHTLETLLMMVERRRHQRASTCRHVRPSSYLHNLHS